MVRAPVAGLARVLAFVQPRTVIAWQKKRFRAYWRRVSESGKPGRPAIAQEVRALIQDMWRSNPTWGSPRIVGELRKLGMKGVKIAPQLPWQNPYCERVIGSIRRDVLDHVAVLHARHLLRLLTAYLSYYHRFRTHLALDMDCPVPRAVEPPEYGPVRVVPEVGGLHHHYERIAA